MRIDTLSKLIDFRNEMSRFNELPENIIIVSPEIIEECKEWRGDTAIIEKSTGIEVYGVKVVRDYAEIF